MAGIAFSIIEGFSYGYKFAQSDQNERAIRQGANPQMASFFHGSKAFYIRDVYEKLTKQLSTLPSAPPGWTGLLMVPAFILVESIDSVYTFAATQLQARFHIKLPEKVHPIIAKPCHFFAHHAGFMLNVAMLASAVALVALGNYAFGISFLGTLGYRLLIERHIPIKLQRLSQRYLPTMANVGIMINTPMLWLKPIMGWIVLTDCSITINNWFVGQMDRAITFIFRRIFHITPMSPTLHEFYSPILSKTSMSETALMKILSYYTSFEVNPGHCSKSAFARSSLPKSVQYDALIQMFDDCSHDDANQKILVKKIHFDDRFWRAVFPDTPRNELVADAQKQNKTLAEYIQDRATEKAAEKNQTLQEFVMDYAKNELQQFVGIVKGKITPEGGLIHTTDLNEKVQTIIAYLQSLPKGDPVIADFVYRIAVEAGNYCTLGLERSINEIIDEILMTYSPKDQLDFSTLFRSKVFQCLQNLRLEIAQQMYQSVKEAAYRSVPDSISSDIHTFDQYLPILANGFCPLTESQQKEFDFPSLLIWNETTILRSEMYKKYLNQMIERCKENLPIEEVKQFLEGYLRENLSLSSEEEIDTLFRRMNLPIIGKNENPLVFDPLVFDYNRYYVLLLVILGVVRPIESEQKIMKYNRLNVSSF